MLENLPHSPDPSLWFLSTGLIIYIFILLLFGLLSDLRTREVSNRITFGVLVLSVPLIYWNMPNIGFMNFAFLAVFVWAYYNKMGAADLKVLFPLLFVFRDVGVFAGAIAVIGVIHFTIEHFRHRDVLIRELTVPYFVPIFLSFVVTLVL